MLVPAFAAVSFCSADAELVIPITANAIKINFFIFIRFFLPYCQMIRGQNVGVDLGTPNLQPIQVFGS